MRVLLTGGTGFIGQHVLGQLVENGHDVTCVRRPRCQQSSETVTQVCKWHECDLADSDGLRSIFLSARPEVVIHLAWYAEHDNYLHSPINLQLVDQSAGLCALAASSGCRRFVAAGTCAEYDVSRGLLAENGPTMPSSLYGAAKLSTSHVCKVLAERAGMAFSWGRVFYVYGPGEDPRRFVPNTIRHLHRDKAVSINSGDAVRDFLAVRDVAAGFISLAQSDNQGIFNICSGQPVTVRYLAELIAARFGRSHLLEFSATTATSFNPPIVLGTNARLRSTGWTPTTGLDNGIDETIAWWCTPHRRASSLLSTSAKKSPRPARHDIEPTHSRNLRRAP